MDFGSVLKTKKRITIDTNKLIFAIVIRSWGWLNSYNLKIHNFKQTLQSPFHPSPALLFMHSPCCPAMVLRTGCRCSCAERGLGRGVWKAYLYSPAAPASTLNPATAACQGGSVAASHVDSCGFGTTDKRGWTHILLPKLDSTWIFTV